MWVQLSALLLIISMPVVSYSAENACGIPNSASVNNQLNWIRVTAVQSKAIEADFTIATFKRALKCKHRLWNTDSTQLGSKPVYFVDLDAQNACLFTPPDGSCVDQTKSFFKDRVKKEAISDLSGYSIVPGGSGRTETLILNARKRDMLRRFNSDSNKMMFSQATKIYHSCARHTSNSTITLGPSTNPITDEHAIAGFVMHEDLHLFQRKWSKPETVSNDSLLAEQQSA